MTILASELERRAKNATETLEKVAAEAVKKNIIIEVSNAKGVVGTDRMMACAGGVRAKTVKTKEGKTVIVEYLFDRNRFEESAAKEWVSKNSKMIEKSVKSVQESAPSGSFSDITMKLQAELNSTSYFPTDGYGNSTAYICYVFAAYCIVSYADEFYQMNYSNDEGEVELSAPTKVEMSFVAKESDARARRFNQTIVKGMEFKPDAMGLRDFELEEAEGDASKKQAILCLIEAGKNFSKNRFYPESTLKEAAPLFAGLKMYMNHQTAEEERTRPERDLADWVSTIEESWYEDGKIMGRVKIHNDDFWKKLKEDQVFRDHVAVSINASGKRYTREIDGVDMEVIEQIVNPRSVDWVTEPGARGRVEYILESQRIEKEREDDLNMLKTVTLEEVQKDRPDLIEAVKKLLEADNKKTIDAAVKEALAQKDKDIESAKLKEARESKIRTLVGAAKLPKLGIEKLCDTLMKETYASDADLEKRVKEAIAAELKYIAEASGRKIGVDPGKEGAETTVKESVQASMEARFGLNEKAKEKKKETVKEGVQAGLEANL
jgi:hypothetical protein